eukprot:EC789884.1.p2 GENE.EC789884.1~~EC789884.1.p2  ORF type:complete len:86 (+),score=20.13 EC789884.1:144-401(+)
MAALMDRVERLLRPTEKCKFVCEVMWLNAGSSSGGASVLLRQPNELVCRRADHKKATQFLLHFLLDTRTQGSATGVRKAPLLLDT